MTTWHEGIRPEWQGRVVLGDALRLLPELPEASVDAVVTDPPYQVELNATSCAWDVWPAPEVWRELYRVTKPGGLLAFTMAPHVAHLRVPDVCAAGWAVLEVGAWVYGAGRPVAGDRLKRCWDAVYFFGKETRRMFIEGARGEFSTVMKGVSKRRAGALGVQFNATTNRGSFTPGGKAFPANVACEAGDDPFSVAGYARIFAVKRMRSAGRTHPTEKPLALVAQIVRLVTRPGGVVADPFAGSGTTGVAAHELGLGFLGFEQDAHYQAVAEARLEQARSQGRLQMPDAALQGELLGGAS